MKIEEGRPVSSEEIAAAMQNRANAGAEGGSPPIDASTDGNPEGGADSNNDPPSSSSDEGGNDDGNSNSDQGEPTFDFSPFNEVTGREFSSIDDFKGYLKEIQESKSNWINPEEVPDSVKQHWDMVKAGKTDRDLYRELAADYESMDDLSVMLEAEMRKEQNQGRDRDLVKKRLQRDLRQKFKEIDQSKKLKELSGEDLEDYLEDNGISQGELNDLIEDGELAQREIEEMAQKSRNSLTESQKKLLEAKAPEQNLDPETQRLLKEHERAIEKAVENYGTASFEVAEDGSLEPYQLSLNGRNEAETQENQKKFQEYMTDPFKATQQRMIERFIDPNSGKLDYPALSKFYHMVNEFDKFTHKITAHVSNQANIDTIQREKTNPASNQQTGQKVTKTPEENWKQAAALAAQKMGRY